MNGLGGSGYISVPESGTTAVVGLSKSTNVGTPGRLVYRVDGDPQATCHGM